MRRVLLSALAWGAFSLPASAAPSVFTNTDDVHACRSLPGGDVVAGTSGGLWRVSGQGTTRWVATALDGMPGTKVAALTPADDGRLWVGTEGGVVSIDLAGSGPSLGARHDTAPVRALAADDGGVLWIGTWGDGVKRLRPGANAPITVRFDGPPTDASVTRGRIAAVTAARGKVIVGTAGAGLFEMGGQRLRPMTLTLSDPSVHTVVLDGDRLWVGTRAGLDRVGMNADGPTVVAAAPYAVRALAAHHGGMLAGTFGSGVRTTAGGRARGMPPAGPDGAQLVQAIDTAGPTACVGTKRGLWLRPSNASEWTRVRRPGPPDNDISALAHDGRHLWVGTFDHGLAKLEENGRWRRIRDAGIDPRINGLAVAGDHAVWVATARGLFRHSTGKARRWTTEDGLPSPKVLSVLVRKNGDVIAGTTRGPVRIREGRLETLGPPKRGLRRAVWALAEDDAGNLWMGTTRGLYRMAADETWTHVSRLSGLLPDEWVTSVAVAGAQLVVGTYNGGAVRLSPSGDSWTAAKLTDGWVNPAGVVIDGDRVLVATMKGLRIASGGRASAPVAVAPGVDTTAVVVTAKGTYIGSRRGLVLRPTTTP